MQEEINWSEKFNNLSLEHRTIGSALDSKLRIQHLNFEKQRLASAYQKSLKEINAHIKQCEISLKAIENKYNHEN